MSPGDSHGIVGGAPVRDDHFVNPSMPLQFRQINGVRALSDSLSTDYFQPPVAPHALLTLPVDPP